MSEEEPFDIEEIKSLPLSDKNTSLLRIASKLNEVVRDRNKNHGKKKTTKIEVGYMANNKTNAHENDVLRWALCPVLSAPSRPSAVYLALFLSDPTENGVATSEVAAANGYTRIQITFGAPFNGIVNNPSQLQFAASTGAWGNITHAGVCRSNVRGTADLLYYGPLVVAANVNAAGLQPTFPPGNITVSEKGPASGLSGSLQGVGSLTGNMTLITPGVTTKIIEGNWHRFRGSGGTTRSDLGVPLIEGDLFDTNINSVLVEFNGTEVQAYVEGRGVFPDGSYRTCLVQANITLAAGQVLPGRVIIDAVPTQPRLTKQALPYTRNLNDPRLAGYPEIGFWPSSVAYLMETKLTGDTISQAAGLALGGRYAVYEKRFNDLFEWYYNNNQSGGTFGLAPTIPCGLAYSSIHIGNTNFNGSNLSLPADDFVEWRNAVGASPNGQNYYDFANICITWACRTGDVKYLKAGLSLAWHHMTQWLAYLDPIWSVNGFAACSEGNGLHYLLTGDNVGKTAIEGMADRFFFQLFNAYYADSPHGMGYGAALTDPDGTAFGIEQREAGRILLCCLVARRLGLTGTTNDPDVDFDAIATLTVNRLLLPLDPNVMLRADGSWRNIRCSDSAGFVINTFMNTILCDALIKYYYEHTADARIPTAVGNFASFAYNNLFDYWNFTFDNVTFGTAVAKSFRNGFGNCCACLDVPIPRNGAANDLTLMYPHLFSFVWKETGNINFKNMSEDVFSEGVGVEMGGGDGPTMDETHTGSMKTFREAHTFSFQHLAYRA